MDASLVALSLHWRASLAIKAIEVAGSGDTPASMPMSATMLSLAPFFANLDKIT